MPELSTHLTFIADPGHGWLKVPLTEIVALGLETQISVYSYIEGQYAYLEARAAQGHPRPEITEQYVDRFARPYLAFHDPSLDATFWDKLRR